MTTELAHTQPWLPHTTEPNTPTKTNTTQRLRDWVDLFRDVVKAAEYLAQTPFVPKEMIGKPADVAAAIMKGHELGMDPLDALANIYVIHGRVGFYAEFMRRRIIQAGHTFKVLENTDNRAIVEGQRKEGGEPQKATFTKEQARNANLNLGNYPADKLLARATSRLCRQAFPDVLSGSLIAEDLIDGLIPTDTDQTPTHIESSRPPIQRQRKPRPAKAAATQPKPQPKPDTTQEDNELLNDDQDDDQDDTIPDEETNQTETNQPPHQHQTQHDDEPQPTLDQPENEPLITTPQTKLLWKLLQQNGFDNRENALAFLTAALNRQITSSKTITQTEATTAIEILENGANQ